MRLIGKLLALPFMLVTGILYLVCKFLVVLSGVICPLSSRQVKYLKLDVDDACISF